MTGHLSKSGCTVSLYSSSHTKSTAGETRLLAGPIIFHSKGNLHTYDISLKIWMQHCVSFTVSAILFLSAECSEVLPHCNPVASWIVK